MMFNVPVLKVPIAGPADPYKVGRFEVGTYQERRCDEGKS